MSGASGSAQLASAVSARLAAWAEERVAERLWARDGSLWAASGKLPHEVAAWLGWLELPFAMRSRIGELSRDELAEVVHDAWLARASKRRAADWLREHQPPTRA